MKAGNCSLWRPLVGALSVGALAFAVGAQASPRVSDSATRATRKTKSDTALAVTGPTEHINSVVAGSGMDILLTPVFSFPGTFASGGASGAGNYVQSCYASGDITGQTLTLDSVPVGCRTFWNLQMRGWGPTGLRLRSWQDRVDAMGYLGANAVPPGGGDLALVSQAGANNAACVTAFGEPGARQTAGTCNPAWVSTTRVDGVFAEQADPAGCGIGSWDVGTANPAGPLFFGTTNPGDPGAGDFCAETDDGRLYYAGTLCLSVPVNAKGTYTIGHVLADLVAADDTQPVAQNITVSNLVAGVLTIPTGSCCFGIGGPAPGCADGLTAGECNALAPIPIFEAGGTCDNPPTDDGCCACLTNADCNDGDACTIDTCSNCVCNNADRPDWNSATQCCDAGSGAICTPTDPNVCANQACSLAGNRGVCETTNVPAGSDCKGDGDENPCTFRDICDGSGLDTSCSGTDVNGAAIPCTTDADCQLATGLTAPACISGLCNCTLIPDLTIDIDPSGKADDNCFDSGDDGAKVTAQVHVAPATAPINGGQFLITYDPSCVSFNSVSGLPPYTDAVYGPIVDEIAGTIFVVVGVGFGVGDGPAGNVDMLQLSFTKIGECNSCNLCFASNNPQNTYLVDNTGQRVAVNPVCSKTIQANNEVEIHGPATRKTNVDCGQPTAIETWPTPTVSDSCGNSTLTCTGEHESGYIYSSDQVLNGGEFPIGVSNLCCTASSDYCDKTDEHCWTVEVNDETSLDIEIGLSPTSQSKPGDDLTRCIKFTLYRNTIQEPLRFEEDVTFGGLFDFVGKSKDAIKIPGSGNWDCITAWDQLHTLRSCYLFDDADCEDGVLHASFRGDPAFGGNWLIGGNLDGWKKNVEGSEPSLFVIDILDYGTFVSQWGADYGSGDTPCGTPGPNADINGDGVVDLLDYAFISMNFLTSAKLCCGVEGLPAAAGLAEISVRELREMGLGDLAVADLNGDGLLNVGDMTAFTQGARPNVKGTDGGRKSGTR